ncbi:MAG: hypothetical protein P1P78_11270 [Methyloprofundus sp.]|nr:hypothetical protein [Methyloprofundus sp.]
MRISNNALLLVTILVASACAPVYVTAPLPLPPKPDMPVYSDSDLSCLSDDQYRWVAMRDLAQRNYQQRLEAVIRSTWEQ